MASKIEPPKSGEDLPDYFADIARFAVNAKINQYRTAAKRGIPDRLLVLMDFSIAQAAIADMMREAQEHDRETGEKTHAMALKTLEVFNKMAPKIVSHMRSAGKKR